jgi:hypothetical protein
MNTKIFLCVLNTSSADKSSFFIEAENEKSAVDFANAAAIEIGTISEDDDLDDLEASEMSWTIIEVPERTNILGFLSHVDLD